MSRPAPPRAARRSAPTYLHLYHGSKPKRQKIGSPIQRLSHTRLHGGQIEQSFIYIKEQQFGSLHKAFIPSLVEFMRFLPTTALGVLSRQCLQRRLALRLISVVATRCPEPPPRPAPGWVEAPMCQSRPTGVAWRPDEARGRHRKLWSSSAEVSLRRLKLSAEPFRIDPVN